MAEADRVGNSGEAQERIGQTDDGLPIFANVVVGRELIFVTGAFARPADTIAYAANDVVSNSTGTPTANLLVFSGIGGQPDNTGFIVKAVLETNQAANVARFRLHLFNAPPSRQGDNAPFTLLFADAMKHVDYIDFPAMSSEGTGSTGARAVAVVGFGNLPLAFNTPGVIDLWGILETLDAFTPASGQAFWLRLVAEVS